MVENFDRYVDPFFQHVFLTVVAVAIVMLALDAELALVVLILAVYGAAAGAIAAAVFGAPGWAGTVALMLGIALFDTNAGAGATVDQAPLPPEAREVVLDSLRAQVAATLREAVAGGAEAVEVRVEGKDGFTATLDLSPRERKVVLAGGVLNQLRELEERGGPEAAEEVAR